MRPFSVSPACGDGLGEAVLNDLDGCVEFMLIRERQFPQRRRAAGLPSAIEAATGLARKLGKTEMAAIGALSPRAMATPVQPDPSPQRRCLMIRITDAHRRRGAGSVGQGATRSMIVSNMAWAVSKRRQGMARTEARLHSALGDGASAESRLAVDRRGGIARRNTRRDLRENYFIRSAGCGESAFAYAA